MKSNNDGFSTPLAMTVIFSLSVIVVSFSLYVAANERKINSYRKIIQAEKEANSIICNIEGAIQILKDYPCDSNDSFLVSSVLYSVFNDCVKTFSVRDVSTGLNKEFLGTAFYNNDAIHEYVSNCEESSFTKYGWINPKYVGEEILEEIKSDYGNDDLFPLVNTFPMFNLYNMEEKFIKSVMEFCHIEKANEKAVLLKKKLSSDISKNELMSIIGVEETHPVFDFLGTKTVFWQVDFETEKCTASVVFAAIPEVLNQKNVEKYILVEKNVLYKGGIL